MGNQNLNTFLSSEKNEDVKKIKDTYADIIAIFNNINDFLYKVIYYFDGIKIKSGVEYLLSCFIELTKYYQSAIIMLEYGLSKSFECILRNIIDLVVKMCFVLKDDANIEKLKKSMYDDLNKKLNYIKRNSYFDVIPEEKLDEWLKISKNELKDLKQKNISSAPNMKKMCEEVGLKKEYVYYGLECDYVHNNFSVIIGGNQYTDNNVLLSIDADYNNFKESGYRLLSIMEIIIPKMVERFTPDLCDECRKLFKESAEKYQKDMMEKR